MADKYFHRLLGSDETGAGTSASPYQTIEKAMSEAGSADEIFGGGFYTPTWFKCRFVDSSLGADTNDGKRPDRAYLNPVTAWNSTDVSTGDYSVVIFVKGSWEYSGLQLFSGGGRRDYNYCGTGKTLKGYEGSDYFGGGKAQITFLSSGLMALSSCDFANFINLSLTDNSPSGVVLALPLISSSYSLLFAHCDFLNFGNLALGGSISPYFYNVKALYCYFEGRSSSLSYCFGFGAGQGGNVKGCYFKNMKEGVTTGTAGSYIGVSQSVFDQCDVAIRGDYLEMCCEHNVFYGNSVAISKFGDVEPRAMPVENCIFYDNALDFDLDGGGLAVSGCCFDQTPGVNVFKSGGADTGDFAMIGGDCLVADPEFVDAAGGDFRLRNSSPCWNMGLVNPYITGNVAHMGAFNRKSVLSQNRLNVYANSRQMAGR